MNQPTDTPADPTDPTVKRATEGFVVPIAPGLGPSDAIDPATSETPVSDAVAAIDERGDKKGYGTVLLPPTDVSQAEPVVPSKFVEFVGWGAHTSTVEFTDLERDGFRIEHFTDGKFVLLDSFTISGVDAGSRTGGSALHFANDSGVHPKQFNIGNLAFRNWIDPVVYCERGSPFDSRWEHLDFGYDRNHGRELVLEKRQSLLGSQIGYIGAGNATGDTVFYTDFAGAKVHIGFINVGGSAGQAVRVKSSSNGHVHIGGINFEPVQSVSNPIVSIQGDASTRLDYVQNTNSEVQSMVKLGFNNGNNVIDHLRNNGTVKKGKIEVIRDSRAPSYYFGPSSDVSTRSDVSSAVWGFTDMRRSDGTSPTTNPSPTKSTLEQYVNPSAEGLSDGELAIDTGGEDGQVALVCKVDGTLHRWQPDELVGE